MVALLKTTQIQEPSSATVNLTLDTSGGVSVGQNLSITGTTSFTGNATAPAFIPSGSTVPTNGLYRPAVNTVGLATNSTNALYIDASQNVGIGTSSPSASAKLTLSGTSTNAGLLVFNSTASANTGFFGSVAALIGSGTSNDLGIGAFGSSNMTFYTNGAERMRIDSSGNVGIATSSPATKFNVNGNVSLGSTYAPPTPSATLSQVLVNTSNVVGANPTYTAAANTGGLLFNAYNFNNGSNYDMIANIIAMPETWTTNGNGSLLRFLTASSSSVTPTEAMRIDKSGNVLIGTSSTTGSSYTPYVVGGKGYASRSGGNGSYNATIWNLNYTSGNMQLWVDASNIGNISTTSDYRIKKNVASQIESGLERINKLRPVTYEFTENVQFPFVKSDGIIHEGFIAHEVAEVIASAVVGEKDAENQIQSLKLDALCSVLVKAIQELTAKVTALEAKVGA